MEQRIRSDYNIIAKTIKVQDYPGSCANKVWGNDRSAGLYLDGSRRSMIDYVIPRFRSRQKAGEKFFNQMSKEEVTVSDVGNGALFTSIADFCPGVKAQTRVYTGYVAALTPRQIANSRGHSLPLLTTSLSDAEILRAQKEVSTETWSKIGTGSNSLWESVAEYHQVLDLLKNPISRLQDLSSRLLTNTSRSSFGRASAKEVSDHYLLYRYGISPLMKDIKGIIDSLNKGGGQQDVTSRAKTQISSASVSPGVTINGSLNANWTRQVNDVVTIRGMHLDRGYVSFANNLGFDLRGLALLPLQLMSYSFVADWFSNLSSYVQSSIPALGWTSLGGCLVTTRVTSTAYTLTNVVNNNPGGITLTESPSGSSSIISVSTTRAGLLNPSFEIKSDFGFDKATRVGDALGLIASRFVKVGNLIGPRPNFSAFHDKKAYHHWASQPGVM